MMLITVIRMRRLGGYGGDRRGSRRELWRQNRWHRHLLVFYILSSGERELDWFRKQDLHVDLSHRIMLQGLNPDGEIRQLGCVNAENISCRYQQRLANMHSRNTYNSR